MPDPFATCRNSAIAATTAAFRMVEMRAATRFRDPTLTRLTRPSFRPFSPFVAQLFLVLKTQVFPLPFGTRLRHLAIPKFSIEMFPQNLAKKERPCTSTRPLVCAPMLLRPLSGAAHGTLLR